MDGRYSLLRYSLGSSERDAESALNCAGGLNVVAGATVPVQSAARFTASLRGGIQGTVAVLSSLPAKSGLGASVRMSANILTGIHAEGVFQSSARAGKNIRSIAKMSGNLSAAAWASKWLPSMLSAWGRLGASASGSKNIPSGLRGEGVLTSLQEATSQITETARVRLTIPPGGELRLDSEFFTALLDGENVLYAQEGDWITLSDRMLRLVVESVSGGPLEGQLIYTERYL